MFFDDVSLQCSQIVSPHPDKLQLEAQLYCIRLQVVGPHNYLAVLNIMSFNSKFDLSLDNFFFTILHMQVDCP